LTSGESPNTRKPFRWRIALRVAAALVLAYFAIAIYVTFFWRPSLVRDDLVRLTAPQTPAAHAPSVATNLPALSRSGTASLPSLTNEEIAARYGQMNVEVCGKGWMRLFDLTALTDTAMLLSDKHLKKVRAAEREVADLLTSSENDALRALGLKMLLSLSGLELAEEHRTGGAPTSLDASQKLVDSLVALARQSVDPAVIQAALASCDSISGCRLELARRMTEVDGDNAVAWLHVATAASERGDVAARDAAMETAFSRRLFVHRELPYTSALRSAPVQALGMFDQAAVAASLMATSSMTIIGAYSGAHNYCKYTQTMPEPQRLACLAFADRLLQHGEKLVDVLTARQIGGRVGWPPEKTSAVQRFEEARIALAPGQDVPPWNLFSCETMVQHMQFTYDMFERGDLAALEQQALLKGKSPPPRPR
jgi:hypothetical protein